MSRRILICGLLKYIEYANPPRSIFHHRLAAKISRLMGSVISSSLGISIPYIFAPIISRALPTSGRKSRIPKSHGPVLTWVVNYDSLATPPSDTISDGRKNIEAMADQTSLAGVTNDTMESPRSDE